MRRGTGDELAAGCAKSQMFHKLRYKTNFLIQDLKRSTTNFVL